MIDIGYSLSRRFPDPPQTDYRTAPVAALRHDLFCGDVYLADTETDQELATTRMGAHGKAFHGRVPVLDFAWALCDVLEQLAGDAPGDRRSTPRRAELDFAECADRLRFSRRVDQVHVTADWMPRSAEPLRFPYRALRREARDFLHDLIEDLTDLHEELGHNPVLWSLEARHPRL